MRQFENKTNGGIAAEMGRRKMVAANRIMDAENDAKKREGRKSQNAYRRACGLPERGKETPRPGPTPLPGQYKWEIYTPSGVFTRDGVKSTGDDMIGYCFASSSVKAVAAFREAHKIPEAIKLTAKISKVHQ